MHEISTYGLIFTSLGAIGFGIYLLVKGGDWAVGSSVYLAEKMGLTKLFIGATVIAFGTSAPELFTSVNANLKGFPGISLGNIIGSNIANILLVLGISAIIYPVVYNKKEVKIDVWMMLIATALLLLGIYMGVYEKWFGMIMLLIIIAYVYYQYKQSERTGDEPDEEHDIDSTREAVMKLLLGFVALILGSEVLVQGAVHGGQAIGVPEAIIGLTVIALGTSLPELAACYAAAIKRHTDIIVGGLVGSNIFNILSIIGITAMLKPLPVSEAFSAFEVFMLVGSTMVASAILIFGSKFNRTIGIIFVLTYAIFISKQFIL